MVGKSLTPGGPPTGISIREYVEFLLLKEREYVDFRFKSIEEARAMAAALLAERTSLAASQVHGHLETLNNSQARADRVQQEQDLALRAYVTRETFDLKVGGLENDVEELQRTVVKASAIAAAAGAAITFLVNALGLFK